MKIADVFSELAKLAKRRTFQIKQQANCSLMQSACTIRPPQSRDYDRMADLARQLGYECTVQEVELRLDGMRDSNHYAIFVAEVPGGRIAGWIGAHVFRSVETERCVEISGLIVDQQIRSRGIGKKLLDAAEEWARRLGCAAISVRSNVKRDRAHHFYTKNGYEHVKTRKEFRKNVR